MRINIISPKYLTDNHLIAEYREMKMITYYYVRSSQTKEGIDRSRISKKFTLNKGHAYMWYDKFGYVEKRFEAICQEMRDRGFKCDYDKLNYTNIPKEAFGDFLPTREDKRINLDRILIRIAKQPNWYKYYGEWISDWNSFYENLFKEEKL